MKHCKGTDSIFIASADSTNLRDNGIVLSSSHPVSKKERIAPIVEWQHRRDESKRLDDGANVEGCTKRTCTKKSSSVVKESIIINRRQLNFNCRGSSRSKKHKENEHKEESLQSRKKHC